MILGMTTFAFVHVALSLIGILSGFVVLYGLSSPSSQPPSGGIACARCRRSPASSPGVPRLPSMR
jgi:hypothetical protein